MSYLASMTEVELRDLFNKVARTITTMLPPRSLFALLVFEDPKLAQYVSNAQRKEIIQSMRECADRLERREDVPR